MWNYTINAEDDEPIMLINKHIGFDEAECIGIDGSLFQQELLRLDRLGKKRIQVWINSGGGVVMDGYSIYNAILKSKTKVDTYCVGIAASIAAVIFQAGRKRIMSDYSLLMYHNPYGGTSKELAKMRDSLSVMIAERTGKSQEEVLKIMDRTTWISASESLMAGFCDEVENSNSINVKRSAKAMALWDAGAVVVNSIIKPKNKSMQKVTNKLGLNADASEESIVSELNSILDKKAGLEEKLAKMQEDYQAAMEKCAKMEEDIEELEDKLKAESEAKAAEEEKAKKAEAKNMVNNFVKAGKIKAESVDKWVEKAVSDLEGVKNLLEELPANGRAVALPVQDTVTDAELTMVAAKAMQEVRNKLNIK